MIVAKKPCLLSHIKKEKKVTVGVLRNMMLKSKNRNFWKMKKRKRRKSKFWPLSGRFSKKSYRPNRKLLKKENDNDLSEFRISSPFSSYLCFCEKFCFYFSHPSQKKLRDQNGPALKNDSPKSAQHNHICHRPQSSKKKFSLFAP